MMRRLNLDLGENILVAVHCEWAVLKIFRNCKLRSKLFPAIKMFFFLNNFMPVVAFCYQNCCQARMVGWACFTTGQYLNLTFCMLGLNLSKQIDIHAPVNK